MLPKPCYKSLMLSLTVKNLTTFSQWNKNNSWHLWSCIKEEYHYVSLAFPSPSSAEEVQRNMPVHITSKTLPDRNCNLTLERSCTMYTVPRGGRTLTDRRAEMHLSCLSHKRFTLTELLALAPSCTCLYGQRTNTSTRLYSQLDDLSVLYF